MGRYGAAKRKSNSLTSRTVLSFTTARGDGVSPTRGGHSARTARVVGTLIAMPRQEVVHTSLRPPSAGCPPGALCDEVAVGQRRHRQRSHIHPSRGDAVHRRRSGPFTSPEENEMGQTHGTALHSTARAQRKPPPLCSRPPRAPCGTRHTPRSGAAKRTSAVRSAPTLSSPLAKTS